MFVIAYMRTEAREAWGLVIPCAVGLTLFAYFVFDDLLALPWPRPLLGIMFPGLAEYIPSLGWSVCPETKAAPPGAPGSEFGSEYTGQNAVTHIRLESLVFRIEAKNSFLGENTHDEKTP